MADSAPGLYPKTTLDWIAWARTGPVPKPDQKANAVLLAIAAHVGADGYCWPTRESIGVAVGLDGRTVTRHLSTLKQLGLIDIEPRSTNRGMGANAYRLKIPGGQNDYPASDRVDILTTAGGQKQPDRVDILTRPHKEQEKEQEKEQSLPAAPVRKSPRKCRLPDEWRPNAEAIEHASQCELDVSDQVERFRNHALDKARSSADWNAAFRTWCSNATVMQPQDRQNKLDDYLDGKTDRWPLTRKQTIDERRTHRENKRQRQAAGMTAGDIIEHDPRDSLESFNREGE